jgi:hypothetical protein
MAGKDESSGVGVADLKANDHELLVGYKLNLKWEAVAHYSD